MLTKILEQLIIESLPITTLVVWDGSTPTGNQTLHSWTNTTVLADWSSAPTLEQIHRLEQALLGRIFSFEKYFDGLTQAEINALTKRVFYQLLLERPNLLGESFTPTAIPPLIVDALDPVSDGMDPI